MNQYFAILTPTTDRLFYAWLAAGLLIIYLVLPLYPNFSETGSAILYIWTQSSVAGGLLFPLLKRWRHCAVLRLMPDYTQRVKLLVLGLFSLFMLLPALLSLLSDDANWFMQAIALLLWSVAGLMSLRFSGTNEKKDNSPLLPLYYLPVWIVTLDIFQPYISWDYLFTVETYLAIVILSLLIWLIPHQKKQPHTQQKKFYFSNVFLFPKSTKLVFAALSSYGFWGFFLTQLAMILFVASTVYFGEAEMFSLAFFILALSVSKLLEQKEKLSVLVFMIGGASSILEK